MIHLSETHIPVDWTCDSIQNGCVKVTSGGTPSRKNKDFYINGGIPWVKTKELEDGYIRKTEESITDDAIKNSSAKILPSGTILLAMYGATVGMLGITQGEMACNQACCALITNSKTLDKDFLFYFLLSNRKNLINLATGAAQQNISGALVKEIAVPRPNLIEQRKIGAVLRTLDDKIELNQKMNQTLEEIAKAIFKSWFVDFDPVRAKMEGRPTGLPDDISDLFPDELVDSEIGEIPKGWKIEEIGKLVKCVGGATPSTKIEDFWVGGEITWTTPKDLSVSDSIHLIKTSRKITEKGLAKISSGLLPVNTVLLSSRAPVGYLALTTVPTAINQGFIALIPNEIYSAYYLLNWCETNLGEIKNRASGTTFAEISKASFRPIKLSIPAAQIMNKFDEQISPIYQKILLNTQEKEILSELRDTLLPKLISGELQIPDTKTFLEEAGI